jgi:hypothetical protein
VTMLAWVIAWTWFQLVHGMEMVGKLDGIALFLWRATTLNTKSSKVSAALCLVSQMSSIKRYRFGFLVYQIMQYFCIVAY